jgi:hypothetical protein
MTDFNFKQGGCKMFKRALFIILGSGFLSPVFAGWDVTAFESITVTTAAVVRVTTSTIPSSYYDDGVLAFCTVDSDSLRWRTDGVSPSTSPISGHKAASGDSFTIYGSSNIGDLRMIGDGTTTTYLRITYQKKK